MATEILGHEVTKSRAIGFDINLLRSFNPVRRLDALVELNVAPYFDEQFKEEVQQADPFIIYTHEAHADGIGAAIVGAHLMKLSEEIKRVPRLRGFAMPVARSFTDGQQGRKLQLAYLFFNSLVSRKGLKTFRYTRPKDGEIYKMSRSRKDLNQELRPLTKRIKQGFAPAVFATGSVEAGRHDIGEDPEKIHGLQRLEGTDILSLARAVKLYNQDRKLFFVIVGLHGGFRLQSPNKEKLYPTAEGLLSFVGWPESFPPHIKHVKMEANLGTIIPEDQMAARFGKDWLKAGKRKDDPADTERLQAINDSIMEQAALWIPSHARGVYGYIELSRAS